VERRGHGARADRAAQSLGRGKGSVAVTDAGRRDPHAALLVLLGVHVVVADEQATAAIVTST
jgi:hypothetical protein